MQNALSVLRRKNVFGTWSGVKGRLDPIPCPQIETSFELSAKSVVYTCGSCFARNIEEYLELAGCKIPTLDFVVPRTEWSGLRSNGILNKYTPAAIWQEIKWASDILKRGGNYLDSDANQFKFELSNGEIIDLQLGGFQPTSPERFYERRRQLFSLVSTAFSADCFTITLGLTEAWKLGELFTQQPPARKDMIRKAGEFKFYNIDYKTCIEMIKSTLSLLKSHNKDIKVIITVSPVPLERTFTEDDIIIANVTSKSILRAAAKAIASEHDNVDYFPSYEIVSLSSREVAFENDMRHVRDSMVGSIVTQLLENYMPDLPTNAALFVAAAVQLGKQESDNKIFHQLHKNMTRTDQLSNGQLTLLLRTSWRVKDRRMAKSVAKELLSREDRQHSTLRAIAHILPRIGMHSEAQNYARGVLERDSSNRLAFSVLENA